MEPPDFAAWGILWNTPIKFGIRICRMAEARCYICGTPPKGSLAPLREIL
jgi:hypothetical protein